MSHFLQAPPNILSSSKAKVSSARHRSPSVGDQMLNLIYNYLHALDGCVQPWSRS